MRQSKLLPAETLFADLCLVRQNVSADAAGASSSSATKTTCSCMHSSPCLAPQGGHSPGFWLLAAIDSACNIFCSRESNLRLLDLARTDTGALEYAITMSLKPEQLIAVDSTPARQLKEQGKPILLWNAWKADRAVASSTGKSTWQLQMPEQPLVDLVVGVVSHTEANAVTGLPAPNEHSTAYRNELLWRCLAALTSLATGRTILMPFMQQRVPGGRSFLHYACLMCRCCVVRFLMLACAMLCVIQVACVQYLKAQQHKANVL